MSKDSNYHLTHHMLYIYLQGDTMIGSASGCEGHLIIHLQRNVMRPEAFERVLPELGLVRMASHRVRT